MKKILYVGFFLLTFVSCQKDSDDDIKINTSNPKELDLHIKDFIWKGMNAVYLWQKQVPHLADNYFASSLHKTHLGNESYVEYLRSFSTPEQLFENLKYSNDRFSFITDDYRKLEQHFSGISVTTGMNFGLGLFNNNQNVFGFVKYVVPNSDAAAKGIKRGDVFVAIDGQNLTKNNYRNLLFSNQSSLTFTFGTIDENTKSFIGTKQVTIEQRQLQQNPIHIHKIYEISNKKIGYLMYNSFISEYDLELNKVFGEFKAAGVTDFILDLRYNSGGSVRTSTYLAGMLTGNYDGQVFVRQRTNGKFKNLEEKFSNTIGNTPINSLNLRNLYVLTSAQTASASELIINGLRAYIEVIQIGDTTVGKNTASITVKDLVNGKPNPSHTWAIQPIVIISENAKGFGEYEKGLKPNYELIENFENLGVLGKESDPLFSKAIDLITGRPSKAPFEIIKEKDFTIIDHSENYSPIVNKMYIDNFQINK